MKEVICVTLEKREWGWRDRAAMAVALLCTLSVIVGVLGGLISLLVGVSIWVPGTKPMPAWSWGLAGLGLVLWVGGNWGHLMLLGHGSLRRGVLAQQGYGTVLRDERGR